ncbi:MAG TPA: hypothetical protein VM223_23200 [Planctomycetota bacterium]|nr:hypothetical protein [Planctomycetota bacterium]
MSDDVQTEEKTIPESMIEGNCTCCGLPLTTKDRRIISTADKRPPLIICMGCLYDAIELLVEQVKARRARETTGG